MDDRSSNEVPSEAGMPNPEQVELEWQRRYIEDVSKMLWSNDAEIAAGLGLGEQYHRLQTSPGFQNARSLWTMAWFKYFPEIAAIREPGEETSLQDAERKMFLGELKLAGKAGAGEVFKNFRSVVANAAEQGDANFFLRDIPRAVQPVEGKRKGLPSFKQLLWRYWFSATLCTMPNKLGLNRLRWLAKELHGYPDEELTVSFTAANYREGLRQLQLTKSKQPSPAG